MVIDATGGPTRETSGPENLLPTKMPTLRAIPSDVTIGELERRLRDLELVEGSVQPGGVRVSSPAEFLNRGYGYAIESQRLAALRERAQSAPGYAALETMAMRLFGDDVNAATCRKIRRALAVSGSSADEARQMSIPDVLARLGTTLTETEGDARLHNPEVAAVESHSSDDTRDGEPEPEAISRAAGETEKPAGGRGRPPLKDTDSVRLDVYRLIHADMLAYPSDSTVKSLVERLKGDSRIRGESEWLDFKDLVKAAVKYIGRHEAEFPLKPLGQKPKPRQ